MINETFIPMQDVLYRIKTNPDLVPTERDKFKHITDLLYMTDKRKDKIFKPIIKNQKRNQNK